MIDKILIICYGKCDETKSYQSIYAFHFYIEFPYIKSDDKNDQGHKLQTNWHGIQILVFEQYNINVYFWTF